jgi:hypothetical protein
LKGKRSARASLLAMYILCAPLARADDILEKSQYFAISPQALNTALVEFAKQANIEVSADGELLRNHRTREIRGRDTAKSALIKLLAGTGLIFRVVDGRVQIRAAEPQTGPVDQFNGLTTLCSAHGWRDSHSCRLDASLFWQ